MGEDQIGIKVTTKFEKVFENVLPRIRKYPRRKRTEDNLVCAHPKDSHRLVVLVFDVFQGWVGLIVRERNTQYVRLLHDVMQERAASQLDIIRVRAEEEDSFA